MTTYQALSPDMPLARLPGLPRPVLGLLAGRGLLRVDAAVEAVEAAPLFGERRHAHVLWWWSGYTLPYTTCLDAEAVLRAAYESVGAP